MLILLHLNVAFVGLSKRCWIIVFYMMNETGQRDLFILTLSSTFCWKHVNKYLTTFGPREGFWSLCYELDVVGQPQVLNIACRGWLVWIHTRVAMIHHFHSNNVCLIITKMGNTRNLCINEKFSEGHESVALSYGFSRDLEKLVTDGITTDKRGLIARRRSKDNYWWFSNGFPTEIKHL